MYVAYKLKINRKLDKGHFHNPEAIQGKSPYVFSPTVIKAKEYEDIDPNYNRDLYIENCGAGTFQIRALEGKGRIRVITRNFTLSE